MRELILEAGFPVYPVLLCGALSAWHAVRHALEPDRGRGRLVTALAAATLLLGVFGAVLGVQVSVAHVTESGARSAVILVGLREALHNLSLASAVAALDALLLAAGLSRRPAAPLPLAAPTRA